MQGAFFLYMMGALAAVIAFIFELLIWYMERYKDIKKQDDNYNQVFIRVHLIKD